MKFCPKTQAPCWQVLKKKYAQSFPSFLFSKSVGIENVDEAFYSLAFKLSQFVIEVNKHRFCGVSFKEASFIESHPHATLSVLHRGSHYVHTCFF